MNSYSFSNRVQSKREINTPTRSILATFVLFFTSYEKQTKNYGYFLIFFLILENYSKYTFSRCLFPFGLFKKRRILFLRTPKRFIAFVEVFFLKARGGQTSTDICPPPYYITASFVLILLPAVPRLPVSCGRPSSQSADGQNVPSAGTSFPPQPAWSSAIPDCKYLHSYRH